jgi:hypothetical protein
LEEGRRLHIEQGNHSRATDNTLVLSNIYLQRGEVEAAREYLRKATAGIREMKDVARFPLALDIGAAFALGQGRHTDALRFLAGAARRRAQVGGGTPNFVVDHDQMTAEARAAVEQQGAAGEADRVWAEGEAMDDDALAALIG